MQTVRADLVLQILEEAEGSEIPIDSPKRQEIEPRLKKVRGALSSFRETLKEPGKEDHPNSGTAL